MMGLLDQFSDFVKTPQGQGLLSAAFGGLAGARRGEPVNSIGRAGLAGMAGYSGALDRQAQQADSAFNQQYRTAQMDALKRQQEKAAAEQDWRGKLSVLMAPKLQGQTQQAQMLADQMGPGATPDDVQAMNAGARMPATGFEFGMDKTALQRHMMDPASPFADKALEQLLYPKPDDYKVVGGDLVKIGSNGVTVAHQSQRPDNLPSEQKLYNLAKEQGYKGTFMDFLRDRVKTTEGAKASFVPETITLPNGQTIITTRENVARQAQPQPSPRPAGPNGYAGGSRAAADSDRLTILQSELKKATESGNIADVNAITNEIARLGGSASPVSGIQVQSEADKQGAIAASKAASEAASPMKVAEKDAQRASIQAQISVIDKALNHPGRKTATGLSGVIDPRNYLPGTNARDFQVVLDQLGGAAFLQAFESLKGGGQITEVEGKKATAAIARLNRAQSDGEFEAALKDLRGVMQRGLSRLGGNGASGSWDAEKTVVKTGRYNGRKVVQYSDGSTEYAD